MMEEKLSKTNQLLDIRQVKQVITDDDIIYLLSELGADFIQNDDKQIIFYSICHHSSEEVNQHKPKLYYYKKSQSFFCFVCQFSGDIFALVQKVRDIDFKKALEWVTQKLRITAVIQKQAIDIDDWQKDLKKFLPNYEEIIPVTVYDSEILKICNSRFHQDWIDYGISEETMRKFNIGFYARCNEIIIPVYYEEDLIGIRIRALSPNDVQKGKYRTLKDLNKTTYKFSSNQFFYGWNENKDKIKKSKTAWIVEAEKTVLKFDTWGCNKCLAVFGSNISKEHINKLLKLGVEHIVLMMDSDFHTTLDDEYKLFASKMEKLINKLKPYFNVELCYNNLGFDAYKFSPTDYSLEDFKKIYRKRVKCN